MNRRMSFLCGVSLLAISLFWLGSQSLPAELSAPANGAPAQLGIAPAPPAQPAVGPAQPTPTPAQPAQPAVRPAQPTPTPTRPSQPAAPGVRPGIISPPRPARVTPVAGPGRTTSGRPQPAPVPGLMAPARRVDTEVPKPDPKAFPKIAEEEPGSFAVDREYLRRFAYARSTLKMKFTQPNIVEDYDPIKILDERYKERLEYGVTIPRAESVYNPSGPSPRPTPIFTLPGQ